MKLICFENNNTAFVLSLIYPTHTTHYKDINGNIYEAKENAFHHNKLSTIFQLLHTIALINDYT